jgi:glycosyltransferase involved in cell wall biosynthesis
MRLLIVSHSYRPRISPRAFRWSSIAEHWASKGHTVDVVCARSPGLSPEEILDRVCVHRPNGGYGESLRAVWELRRVSSRQVVKAVGEPSQSSTELLPRVVKLVNDTVWRRLYWPDYACLWWRSAISTAQRLLSTGSFDAFVTVSLPFTSHLVGLSLKRRFPNIPWLVDIGDPFCFMDQTPPNNFLLYRSLNKWVEGKVFQNADAISVTTPETREEYCRQFGAVSNKITVIPPLVSSIKARESRHSNPTQCNVCRIVYAGTLYRAIRNPRHLLQLFTTLVERGRPWELHFLGALHDCEPEFNAVAHLLKRNIFLHGCVNRDEAIRHMQGADLLVNLGNAATYQLPSKVVEYAMLRRPILNLTTAANDSSTNFFRNYPLALTIQENTGMSVVDQAARVEQFVASRPSIGDADWEKMCSPFRIADVATAYEKLILKYSHQNRILPQYSKAA